MIPLSLSLIDVVLPEGLMWVSRASLLCWGLEAWPVLLAHRPHNDRRTRVRVHHSILLCRLAQKILFMQAAPGLAWQAAATKGTRNTTIPPCLPFIPWHGFWYIAAHILCWICLTEIKHLLHLIIWTVHPPIKLFMLFQIFFFTKGESSFAYNKSWCWPRAAKRGEKGKSL